MAEKEFSLKSLAFVEKHHALSAGDLAKTVRLARLPETIRVYDCYAAARGNESKGYADDIKQTIRSFVRQDFTPDQIYGAFSLLEGIETA